MESAPPLAKKWLLDYMASLGIVLAWKEPHKQSIVTTHTPLAELEGIVRQT